MPSAKDFDYSATLLALDAAYKLFPEDSAEAKAIRLAVSLMIFTAGKRPVLKEFLKWLEVADLPASQVPFNALHEFATQEEADAWRASGQANDGDRIIIAGKGYEVVDVPPYGLKFAWAPLPEDLAALESEDDSSGS